MHPNSVLEGRGQHTLPWHAGELGKLMTPNLWDPACKAQLCSSETLHILFFSSAEQMWKILKSWKQPDLLEKCGVMAVSEILDSPLCWAPQLVAAWCAQLSLRMLGCSASSWPSKLGQAWQDGQEAASSLG